MLRQEQQTFFASSQPFVVFLCFELKLLNKKWGKKKPKLISLSTFVTYDYC